MIHTAKVSIFSQNNAIKGDKTAIRRDLTGGSSRFRLSMLDDVSKPFVLAVQDAWTTPTKGLHYSWTAVKGLLIDSSLS